MFRKVATVLLALFAANRGWASHELEEVVVFGRAQQQLGVAQTASEGMVGYDDIQLPPLLRVGELLEAVPGMVATQHSGTGKANQYFLRGFNLDHGTDFSAHVDGVPINMRSHGHGQGYLDLNFLIPELVETTHYRKGPYHPGHGDFSSAGSADFSLYRKLNEAVVKLSAGEYGYRRGLAAGSAKLVGGTLVAAVDVTRYDGPWDLEENLEQYKGYLGYSVTVADYTANLTLQAYDSEWDATDQIPLRAVESGLIDDLGFIDPDLGGKTQRYAATATLEADRWALGAYLVDYDFTLYSNFTYRLDNPVDGDEFEQRDNRQVWGAWVEGEQDLDLARRTATLRWGANTRYDDIGQVGLFSTTARQRIGTTRDDSVDQWSAGAWAALELPLTGNMRAIAGLRGDYFDWDVDALRDENSGAGDDSQLSPSFKLAYRVSDRLETYASWGQGFHSNDVRGATISRDPGSGDAVDPVDVLVQSEGAELGLRYEINNAFNVSLVGFWLELDSELLYVGDAGTTEPNDGSERNGIEVNSFLQVTDWLALNAAYTWTDAEFQDDQAGGREIPGAVEETFTLGATAAWQNGFSASMRLRYLGEAPLVEDDSVRAEDSWLVNASAGYRRGPVEFRVEAFNLFDSDDNDIAYFYASRLAGEPDKGIEDVHFHPLEPRSVRGTVMLYF